MQGLVELVFRFREILQSPRLRDKKNVVNRLSYLHEEDMRNLQRKPKGNVVGPKVELIITKRESYYSSLFDTLIVIEVRTNITSLIKHVNRQKRQ